jgi:GT2 family glycosyltransferase
VGQLQKQQVFSWYEESKSVCLLVDMKSPDPILEDYLAPRGSLSFRLSSPEPLISSPSEQRVGVLLRQWDSFDLTSNCIESLLLQQQVSYTIYLLDDASQDDSGFQLFIHFPQIIIIPLVTRAEYCLSFNILAKYSEFDGCTNIFIVNNDTKDFHRQLLFQLSAALHERDVGIVSPKVLDFDNELVHWKPRRWLGIQFDLATEAYMLRISSWNAVGGFNNSYFRYCEDLRLCFDLRNLGLKQKLVTTVSLQHLGNGSSKKMAFIPVFYFSRNLVWIQKLHYGNTYLLKAVGQAYPRSKDQVSQKIKLFPKHRRLGTLILHLYMCSGLMSGIFPKSR